MKSILALTLSLVHFACFSAGISTNLTAVFDQQKRSVKLKWQNNDTRITAFVLQKSADNNKWNDIYTVETDVFSLDKIEKFTDDNPAPDKNYYRLEIILENNNKEISPLITVLMGEPAGSWVMFPVPVTSVLNLQYTGSEQIKGVITVFIQNAQGKVLMQTRSSSLNRVIQIPVSNLGKGIYDVRIMIENKIVWNQRFIK